MKRWIRKDGSVVGKRRKRKAGTGGFNKEGYLVISVGSRDNKTQEYYHRIKAERALGRPLPAGVQIHHFMGDKSANAQLVICPDQAYHMLLHRREWRSAS